MDLLPIFLIKSSRSRAIPLQIDQSVIDERIDFRNKSVFTIDPVDAKDFDDALSIEELKWASSAWVHIADVTHYVRPGSALDEEAHKRQQVFT